jgi:hypothetical protein
MTINEDGVIKRTQSIAKSNLPGVQEYDLTLAQCLVVALNKIEALEARIKALEQAAREAK